MTEMQANVGRFARSVETGWVGKIVAVEMHGEDAFYKMQGVDTLAMMLVGGSKEENLSSDDVQYFTHEDVIMTQPIKTITVGDVRKMIDGLPDDQKLLLVADDGTASEIKSIDPLTVTHVATGEKILTIEFFTNRDRWFGFHKYGNRETAITDAS